MLSNTPWSIVILYAFSFPWPVFIVAKNWCDKIDVKESLVEVRVAITNSLLYGAIIANESFTYDYWGESMSIYSKDSY